MHNPGIFRNLAYVELEPYSEPWYIQNTVKNLRWNFLKKNSYLVHFYPQYSKISYVSGNRDF